MQVSILTYNTHGLPWSRDESKAIARWLPSCGASVICLQEVFTEQRRNVYESQLNLEGYRVIRPRDTGVAWLSSGLLTAYLEKDFTYISDCFCSFNDIHDVEFWANKGFHVLRLIHKTDGRRIAMINTHTQSDNELIWFFGKAKMDKIRFNQFDQILRFMSDVTYPVLVAGDLNCELSPHPHLRFLHPITGNLVRKCTFYRTGEDLDHVAWLPLQWARPGCHFCDVVTRGPIMELCMVFQKPWSDHAPVYIRLRLPPLITKPEVRK